MEPYKIISDYPALFLIILTALLSSIIGLVIYMFKGLKSSLAKHVQKEEEITWPKIEKELSSIRGTIYRGQLENTNRFGQIESRMAALESRMPNGEIDEILSHLKTLNDKVDEVLSK